MTDLLIPPRVSPAHAAALTRGSLTALHRHVPIITDWFGDSGNASRWLTSTNGNGTSFAQDQSSASSWIQNDPAPIKMRLSSGSGSASTDRRRIYSRESQKRASRYDVDDLIWEWYCAISSTSQIDFYIELTATNGNTALPVPYICVQLNSANSNARFRSDDGSFSNDQDVGSDFPLSALSSTFAWVSIAYDSAAGELVLYLDAVEVDRLTLNLPSGTAKYLNPSMLAVGNGATWKSIYFGFFIQSVPMALFTKSITP